MAALWLTSAAAQGLRRGCYTLLRAVDKTMKTVSCVQGGADIAPAFSFPASRKAAMPLQPAHQGE
jgi:hypothetical protein